MSTKSIDKIPNRNYNNTNGNIGGDNMDKMTQTVRDALLKMPQLSAEDQAFISGYIEAAANAQEEKKKKGA
jgi:hypothetical protein